MVPERWLLPRDFAGNSFLILAGRTIPKAGMENEKLYLQ
jgi:hypothetical protein